jgi:tungstate transport system ATP-binding protein
MSIITITSADVRFGRVQALQDVSLAVQRGECVALVGANGSGKSTLLRLAYGLVPPTQGKVALQAQGSANTPSQRQTQVVQAFVFQRPFVLRASVLTNVALPAWLRGASWAQAKQHALQALAQVGLQALATRQARTLSGGQQQRLTFARALTAQPDVLLLDEPTASLAPEAKRDVEALIAQCTQQGMTVLFASHNLGQVKRLAHRVVQLDAGRIVVDLPVAEFFHPGRSDQVLIDL